MNFESLIDRLITETTQTSLGHFVPELALCAAIVALLVVRLFNADRWLSAYWIALAGSLIAFGLTGVQFESIRMESSAPDAFFTGLLVFDPFTVFFRLYLYLFLFLVIILTGLSGVPDPDDGTDFYTLLLGSVVGMSLMVSANHLLILFLGVEMASVPSYVLVGFLKGRRLSSEAALKYVVYGSGAAGVMLYGISLLAGVLGTAELPELAVRLNMVIGPAAGLTDPVVRTVALGIMMVLVGLAFKLSLVPFHFWCPDAFEGASAEVAGFLSVASKAAAFALLVRFCLAFVGDSSGALADIYLSFGVGLGIVAAVTATYGNLAAYAQTNVKRLLAYSTIAHAGYMLMAVAALLVVTNAPADSAVDPGFQGQRCLQGLLYYLLVYLFMNLGAFAIVAILRNLIFSEEIEDYNGLASQAPVLCVCMAICLFSLVGIPPLGGFIGKFMVFASLFEAGKVHWVMWAVLVVGGLNTVFSLFYYLRVVRAMFMEPRPEGARPAVVPRLPFGTYVITVSLPILIMGMGGPWMARLSEITSDVASVFFR